MRIKKFLSTFLVCVMAVCAMSVTAFADEVFSFEELQDAINNAKDGEETEIVLGNDIVISGGNTVTGLLGEGTEASPYLINSIDELKWFRDDVNAGNNYSGKYISLTSDIDLEQEDWTPIGNSTNQFKGYFDGLNHTISNLKVAMPNSNYAGLFGYIKGTGMTATAIPTVQNLNLKDAFVQGYNYVGGLAGQGFTCKVSNINISGEVYGNRYVGGLIGHVYVYFDNCHFVGDVNGTFDAIGGIAGAGDGRIYNSSVIGDVNGKNWVGGIIANGQEGTSVVGCYVKGTVSTGKNYYFGVGGIAGVGGHGYSSSVFKDNYFDGEVYLAGEKVDAIVVGIINADGNASIGTTVEGNSWNTEYYSADTPVVVTAEVTIEMSPEDWAASASAEKSSVRNNNLVMLESDLEYIDAESAEDVTIMSFSNVTETQVEQAVIENNSKAHVAQIGETKYATLTDAIKAAKNGDTVTLLDNIKIDTTIKNTKNITLDLNGKTITGTDNATGSFALIEVQPDAELIITDTSAEKSGKITLTSTNNRGWNAYSSVISNQRGKLIVNGGTIEHLGGTDMAYGIDNLTNTGDQNAETIINDGTIKSTYRAIRQFLNSAKAQNILTVNGGTIEGANKSIWMQDANASANPGKLTVAKGATLIGDVYLYVAAGSTEWPVEVSIVKAAVNGEVLSANVPAGYEVVEENGYYGVVEKVEKPVLPEATVTELNAEELGLTFALNFKSDEVTDAQLEYYGDWFADFVLTVNKDVTFNANGGADGYLSGQYEEWSENWVNVPFDDVTLKANTPLRIMEYAAQMMGQPGLKLTYNDVYSFVKDFNCGVFFIEEFLAANPDFEVTLALNMYNPEDETEVYVIGPTYEFEAPVAEKDKYESLFLYVTYSDTYEDTNGNPDAYKLHLFAGIDSLKYSEVGFDVYYNGQFMMNCPTTTVYRSVTTTLNGVPDTKVYPTAFYNEANYIYGYTLYFDPDWDNLDIECKPYFVKLDGTKVPGYSFTINDVYPTTIEG